MKYGFKSVDLMKYEKLGSEGSVSGDEGAKTDEDLTPAWKGNFIRYALSGLITTAILAISLFVWHGLHTHTPEDYQSPDCGETAAQAKASGCHYEPMQRSWIPDECYFSEPSEEYTPFDDREWYIDKQLQTKLTDSELLKLRTGDDLIAYTKFFHHEHCLYAWRKLALAVERHLPFIDSKTANLEHSTHCSKKIASLIYKVGTYTYNDTGFSTFSPLMFQTCVPLRWN